MRGGQPSMTTPTQPPCGVVGIDRQQQDLIGVVDVGGVDAGVGHDEAQPVWQPAAQRPVPPIEQMQAMSAVTFFNHLARLMVDNPPAAADGPMMVKLQRLGIRPGQMPNWGLLDRWWPAFLVWGGLIVTLRAIFPQPNRGRKAKPAPPSPVSADSCDPETTATQVKP